MRRFRLGERVCLKRGKRPMIFGGVITGTDIAYLTWAEGGDIRAKLVPEGNLKAFDKTLAGVNLRQASIPGRRTA